MTPADREVSQATRQLLYDGVAPRTREAYGRAWVGFERWCDQRNRSAMPAASETLAEYVGHLATRGMSPATIEQAVAAIRTRHRAAGHGRHYPDTELALLALKGHRRHLADEGRSGQRKAAPVVVESLRAMVATCDLTAPLGQRDQLLLLLGVTLYGRRSELAALRVGDVTETVDGLLIRIHRSKTDQGGAGVEVAIMPGAFPGTDPVRVFRAWVATLGTTEGRLLRSVDRHGHIGAGLSPAAINLAVRRRAVLAGLPNPEKYTAHSLRAGGATIAYMNGAPLARICEDGRWQIGSAVVMGYIRSVDQWQDHPFQGAL